MQRSTLRRVTKTPWPQMWSRMWSRVSARPGFAASQQAEKSSRFFQPRWGEIIKPMASAASPWVQAFACVEP
jgi:hypothetical protein